MKHSMIITNCTIFDGTGSEPITGHSVVVADGRIADVIAGDAAAVRKKLEYQSLPVVDAGGKYLLPGLIDAHMHLHGYSMEDATVVKLWHLTNTNEAKLLHAVKNLSLLQERGFTFLRVMGMPHSMDVHLRDAVNEGVIEGPRMICSGQELSMTAGHGDLQIPPWAYREPGLTCDGVDECIKAVRCRLREGVDFIKIHTSGGCMSNNDRLEWRNYRVEEIRAITDEAHAFGLRVAAYAEGREGIRTALLGGVDTIEHGFYLDDELIEIMLKQGTYLIPTLSVGGIIIEKKDSLGIPKDCYDKSVASHEANRKSALAAYKAGVKIAYGSDAFNVPRVRESANEFRYMYEAGIPTLAIIRAATLGAADAMNIMDETGSIEKGKFADMILVSDDPRQDITVLGDPDRTCMVMKQGRIVVQK